MSRAECRDRDRNQESGADESDRCQPRDTAALLIAEPGVQNSSAENQDKPNEERRFSTEAERGATPYENAGENDPHQR